MKLTLLAFSLFGSVAIACPNLSGTFVATFNDGMTEELVVTQSEVNGVTNFNLVFDGGISVTAIADGVARTIETTDSAGGKMINEDTYVCSEDKVTNTYMEHYVAADGAMEFEQGVQTFSLDASGNILNHVEYSDLNGQKGVANYTYSRYLLLFSGYGATIAQ